MNPISLPTHLHFLQPEGASAYLIQQAITRKTALFLSETAASRLGLLPMIQTLSTQGKLLWIKAIPSNPSYRDLEKTLRQLNGDDYGLFIAIGGGSAMDLAKSAAALLPLTKTPFTPESILEAIQTKAYLAQSQRPYLIAVPTTAGTGSELTRWATLWDFDHQVKLSVEAPDLAFDEALIVSDYTKSMPLRLTLSTGLDALTQAAEAYWAKTTVPFVQTLALQSIRIIVRSLPRVLKEPDNLQYRRQMMIGSLLGAMAFSNTKTTACHSISYPLTLNYHLDHGLACVLTLPDLLRHNLGSIHNPENLYEAFNIDNPEALRSWIEKTADGIASLKLSDYGITEKDLESIAEQSYTLGHMDNNPVPLTPQQVQAILKLHL